MGYSDREAAVYTVRASDGGGLRRLADFIGTPSDYAPARDRIVFVGDGSASGPSPSEVGTLYVVGTDGSGLRAITPTDRALPYSSTASWSPDGAWIAFVTADRALGLVRPDGSGLHEVTLPPDARIHDLSAMSWSPDGDWIAFSATAGGGENPDIYLVRVGGANLGQVSDLQHLTDTPDVAEFPQDWSS